MVLVNIRKEAKEISKKFKIVIMLVVGILILALVLLPIYSTLS